MHTLVSWIGNTDMRAARGDPKAGLGPIGQAVDTREFNEIALLTNFPQADVEEYLAWLRTRTTAPVSAFSAPLSSPTNLSEIYQAARDALLNLTEGNKPRRELTLHLSPGTPAMAAVWILLAKTRFPAGLIESSVAGGVKDVSVPFDIAADFVPDLLRQPDAELERLSAGMTSDAAEFGAILHRSAVMKRVITKARRVALRSIPVLIEGESGTGKELLARAIHQSGPRREKPFRVVNCGAIPSELLESELFGHKKGAFTGAIADRPGFFEAANGGTLFLDEVGELPKPAQVKLLRVLQEGEVTRVGETEPRKVDVRVVSATNRILTNEIADGRFREDLFYRLAVAILKLPALRERQGDVGLLIDALLEQVNRDSKSEPGYKDKNLSAGARNLLLRHSWPGNVRELLNTLRRAAVWASGPTISEEDIGDAIIPSPRGSGSRRSPLDRPIEQGIDLSTIIGEVSRHYIQRALEISDGSKTKAAALLGFSNYQTLTNWMKKYEVKR